MPRRSHKTQKSDANLKEFVAVTCVSDMDQAKDYETLLKSSDIPVAIRQQNDQSSDIATFAVMVPEDFVDEAHVIIESQDAYDDFYDFTSDGQDEAEFDAELFDEEF